MYREHEVADLPKLLLPFSGEKTASAMLSADLTLRFLPNLIQHLQNIDADDPLIDILQKILDTWHYSSIGFTKIDISTNMEPIMSNPCLLQLYANRIIQKKDKHRAQIPVLLPIIKANLGWYQKDFWANFQLTKQN